MIFAVHASTGSSPQSTSPTVFTLIVTQPETHIFWYVQLFSGSRLLGCVYTIIFFLKDAMSYKMWRLHVIIIQPASGRLQGYVLKFPCLPNGSYSACNPRKVAQLSHYPPRAEVRARAREGLIARPFTCAKKKFSQGVTQKRVGSLVLSSDDFSLEFHGIWLYISWSREEEHCHLLSVNSRI